ncbi:hypothetical protein [Sagittula sp. SSi028]|uniref:hypothetical protein n=1 Tax=Sagittula sp. SSi028 TaxID=3400636 RepID=UPI003AF87729
MTDEAKTPENRAPEAAPTRLRHSIDSGATGEKVAFSDPAAAPLGTDAEAGGARLGAAEVAQIDPVANSEHMEKPTPAERYSGLSATRIIGMIAVAILVLALGIWVFG